MSRQRANDYDMKAQAIMDNAAALFAQIGYPNTKMLDIAKDCGVSKSMLYHYFPTKDELLFTILEEHLEGLVEAIKHVLAANVPQQERFTTFVQVYTQRSTEARRRHVIAMNDLRFLSQALQLPILTLEKKVTTLVADMLRDLKPGLPDETYKPYTMLLIGMLNWTDTWYKPSGKLKPQGLYALVTRLFLQGFMSTNSMCLFEN